MAAIKSLSFTVIPVKGREMISESLIKNVLDLCKQVLAKIEIIVPR